MSAVNVLAFGVTCEISDDDYVPVVQDHLRLPPQEAQPLAVEFGPRLREQFP